MKKLLVSLFVLLLGLPLYSNAQGLSIEVISRDTTVYPMDTAPGDAAEFEFKLRLTPQETDMWLYRFPSEYLMSFGTSSITWTVLDGNGNIATTENTFVALMTEDVDDGGLFFKVEEGDSSIFSFVVWINPEVDGFYRVRLDNLQWSATGPTHNPSIVTPFTNNNTSSAVFVQGVPEPGGAVLALVGGMVLLVRRRR